MIKTKNLNSLCTINFWSLFRLAPSTKIIEDKTEEAKYVINLIIINVNKAFL